MVNKKFEQVFCSVCGLQFTALSRLVRQGRATCCSVSCSAKKASAAAALYGAHLTQLGWKRERQNRRKMDPEHRRKDRARNVVRNEIRRGRMSRGPCAVCGDPQSEAHHSDYSKPLEIVWLCRKHHVEEDMKCRQQRNDCRPQS